MYHQSHERLNNFFFRIAPEHRTPLSNYRRISLIIHKNSVKQYICLEVGLDQMIGFDEDHALSCL